MNSTNNRTPSQSQRQEQLEEVQSQSQFQSQPQTPICQRSHELPQFLVSIVELDKQHRQRREEERSESFHVNVHLGGRPLPARSRNSGFIPLKDSNNNNNNDDDDDDDYYYCGGTRNYHRNNSKRQCIGFSSPPLSMIRPLSSSYSSSSSSTTGCNRSGGEEEPTTKTTTLATTTTTSSSSYLLDLNLANPLRSCSSDETIVVENPMNKNVDDVDDIDVEEDELIGCIPPRPYLREFDSCSLREDFMTTTTATTTTHPHTHTSLPRPVLRPRRSCSILDTSDYYYIHTGLGPAVGATTASSSTTTPNHYNYNHHQHNQHHHRTLYDVFKTDLLPYMPL